MHPETGEPRNALTSEAVTLCRQLKSQSTRLTDIIGDKDPLVADFIRQGIKAANAEASSDGAKIIKWMVLETDFSVAGGELGEPAAGREHAGPGFKGPAGCGLLQSWVACPGSWMLMPQLLSWDLPQTQDQPTAGSWLCGGKDPHLADPKGRLESLNFIPS